jgi:hypothetical protein
MINPDRERQLSGKIRSIIQTLNHKVLTKTVQQRLREQAGSTLEDILKECEEAKKSGPESVYSIFSEVAVAGFEAIGRRPKYHLIANILWIIDFELRKVDRKPSLFLGNRASTTALLDKVEEEYDEILDILLESIKKNYGDDEYHHALDMVVLRRGHETEFDKHMRLQRDEDIRFAKEKQA